MQDKSGTIWSKWGLSVPIEVEINKKNASSVPIQISELVSYEKTYFNFRVRQSLLLSQADILELMTGGAHVFAIVLITLSSPLSVTLQRIPA